MFQLPVRDPCPFCEYVAGRPVKSPIDASDVRCAVVEERRETFAFVNTIRPVGYTGPEPPAPWVLIIPRRHAPTLLDLSEAEASALMVHAHRIATAVTAAFELDGLRLLQNNGIAGDQTVPHFHLHIILCRQHDGADRPLPSGRGPRVPYEERQAIAERIRARLDG